MTLFKTLKVPAKKFTPASTKWNTAILIDRTWEKFSVKEDDRSILPILHHRGYANTLGGSAANAAPIIFSGVPSYYDPPLYWGKGQTILHRPRSVWFDTSLRYRNLYNDATGFALLHDHNIFSTAFNLAHYDRVDFSNEYFGFITGGLPWSSVTVVAGAGEDGGDGAEPSINADTFIGGQTIFLMEGTGESYVDRTNPSIPVLETAFLTHEINQFVPCIAKFEKVQMRFVDPTGFVGAPALYTTLAAQCVSAGIDFHYDGPLSGVPGVQVAADIVNIKAFFGIP